jgi:hypothetical protein
VHESSGLCVCVVNMLRMRHASMFKEAGRPPQSRHHPVVPAAVAHGTG